MKIIMNDGNFGHYNDDNKFNNHYLWNKALNIWNQERINMKLFPLFPSEVRMNHKNIFTSI